MLELVKQFLAESSKFISARHEQEEILVIFTAVHHPGVLVF